MKFKAAIFDLDGTLLNSLEDLGRSTNHIFAAHGLPEHPIEAYKNFVGEGAEHLIRVALPEVERNKERIALLLEEFKVYYAEHWQDNAYLYEGVEEMLRAIASRGLKMAVLSNKPHEITLDCVSKVLSQIDFKVIFGHRKGFERKPNPESALELAGLLNAEPEQVLYFGDTAIDMQTAEAAGFFKVGVTWGFRPQEVQKQIWW